MGLSNYILNFNCNENKTIYLILFLPIALIAGSLVINITVFLIIFIFIYELYKKKRFYFILNKEFYFFLAIFFYILINSIFVSESSHKIISALGNLRFIFLSFALAYYLKLENGKYEKKIYNFWAIVLIVVTIDIFFEYTFGHNLLNFKSNYDGRIASFTGSELKIGGYYFGFILLTLSFIYLYNKNIFYPLFIILLIAALLIGERANFIKIIFIAPIFFFIIYKTSILKKIIIFLIVTMVVSFIIALNEPTKNRFYNEIFNKIENIGLLNYLKTNKHGLHYVTSIEVFKQNKLFGIGYKNFRYESHKKKYNINNDRNVWAPHPHQIHFEFLSELGIIGYLMLMSLLIYYITNGFIAYKKNKNLYTLSASLFILATILPIIPSGSFFTTFTATIFWINISIILKDKIKYNY